MRNMVHNAVASARDILTKATDSIQQGNVLNDDELLQRYVTMHRGNPLGMANFVVQNRALMEGGGDVMGGMRSYEQNMEKLMKSRGMK